MITSLLHFLFAIVKWIWTHSSSRYCGSFNSTNHMEGHWRSSRNNWGNQGKNNGLVLVIGWPFSIYYYSCTCYLTGSTLSFLLFERQCLSLSCDSFLLTLVLRSWNGIKQCYIFKFTWQPSGQSEMVWYYSGLKI